MDFKFDPTNIKKNIIRRKGIDLLPSGAPFTENDGLLSKFLDITLDQWMQKAQVKDANGFIGRRNGLNLDASKDFYLDEPSKDRRDYQVEPTVVSEDNNENINYISFYNDYINHLRFSGALTHNHSRLFGQEYYSWAPPINVDMLANFSNYFWLLEGPTLITIADPTNAILDIIGQETFEISGIDFQSGMKIILENDANAEFTNIPFIVEGVGTSIRLIDDREFTDIGRYDTHDYDTFEYDSSDVALNPDYVTCERGGLDRNPWSRCNRWFHKDLIQNLDLENLSIHQAKRPIIQFEANIQLRDYGRIARDDISFIIDDTKMLDIIGLSVFALEDSQLSDGDRVLFLKDDDPAKGKIFKVFGLDLYGAIGLSLEKDGLDIIDGIPVEGEKVLIRKGNINRGKELYFDGTEWIASQEKITRSQNPIYELYDYNGVRLDDEGVYPTNNFDGSFIFSFEENSTVLEEITNKNISFDTFGNIQFNNNIANDSITFELNFEQQEIPGLYFYRQFIDENVVNDDLMTDWHKSELESRQFIKDEFTLVEEETPSGTEIDRFYTLSIAPDAGNENIKVSLNGIKLIEGTDYSVSGDVVELSLTLALANNDFLETKSYAATIPEGELNGFFEIPTNLENNPNNDEVGIIKYNEMHEHFISIIENQSLFEGISRGANNYGSTARDLTLGRKLLQHTAPLLNTFFTSGGSNVDFINALRFSGREYSSFRRKFVAKIQELNTQGFSATTPTNEWIEEALRLLNLGKTDVFPFTNSSMTADNNYIPATPAALGVLPLYEPIKFVDDTRLVPTEVIRCHDGSYINAFGNYLDDVILDLENQIYNNVDIEYQDKERIIEFDVLKTRPGFFRDTEYSRDEWNIIIKPSFDRFAIERRINHRENVIFDQFDPFTWNYGKRKDTNNNFLPGNWRGIYEYYYDTDRPHMCPWEMLGFSQKPDWWDTEYGVAPYTGGNLVLWSDIENGTIKQGPKAGTHDHLKRPGLSNMIPVDVIGQILNPMEAGIVGTPPDLIEAAEEWKFGDSGPGEYTWKINEVYTYSLSEALYLMKPAKFLELGWEANNQTRTLDQFVFEETLKRRKQTDLIMHNELDSNNELIKKAGISQWISHYVASFGLGIDATLGSPIRDLGIKLGYRASAFTKAETMRLATESFGIIPQENVHVQLYQTNSIRELVYSGIIVEWTGKSYRVSGYDQVNQYFNIEEGLSTGKKTRISQFGRDVTRLDTASGIIKKIPYGTEFGSFNEVYNFFISYQRFLESEGWIFDDIEDISRSTLDFDYEARRFLEWTTNDLVAGEDALAFSPLALKAKISLEHGQVDDIESFTNGVYNILNIEGFGIRNVDFETNRQNQTFEIKLVEDSTESIYYLRAPIIEYEHVFVIDNISKFNDLIYNTLIGLRQERFDISIQKTELWDGTATALGFIIQDDTILENYETLVDNMRQYFSFENLESETQQKQVAKHLIGYQDRDYFDNLNFNKRSQFEFYRGMIREKGTRNNFEKMLRSDFVTRAVDFSISEEWAFLIGEYGDTTSRSSLQLQVRKLDFKTNPQIIRFTNELTDNPLDSIIDMVPDDERWVLQRSENLTIDQFPLRGFVNETRKDLPNAGYVRTDETTHTIVAESDLETLYDDLQLEGKTLAESETIWNVILDNTSWDVKRLSDLDHIESIEPGTTAGDPGQIKFENPHNLSVGDIFYILASTESNPDYEGYNVVVGVIDAETVEVETPVNANKVFATGEGPTALSLNSVRFADIAERDAFDPLLGWKVGDLVWVDDAGTGTWAVYRRNSDGFGPDWTLDRIENDKIDIDDIFDTFLYNNRTNLTLGKPRLFDPYKGILIGEADREIFYKLEFDPAKYTDGDEEQFQIDPDQAWGNNQTAQLWWDLSAVRYVDYEQGDIEYRRNNWGKIVEGTEINVYEWTRSPVTPSGWDSYVEANISTGTASGFVKFGADTPYVTKQEFDTAKGAFINVYYFWVGNPSFIPSGFDERKISAQNVALLLENNESQNSLWFAPIDTNSFLLNGADFLIDDEESVLQINFNTRPASSSVHKQWLLASENDTVTIINDLVWDKMRDSLVGFDDMNLSVPDPALREAEKYGMTIRPRQTWFIDMLAARKEFVRKINTLLSENNIVDNNPSYDDNLHGEDPQPAASEYDFIVFDRAERDALIGTIIPGQKVLVESDQVFNGKWSLWQYDGATTFTLIEKQIYKVEDFWEFINWFADGFDLTTHVSQTFADIPARNSGTFVEGELIRVEDNGTGRFSLYVYHLVDNLDTFELVGQENGTIEFKTSLYDYDLSDTELNTEASISLKEILVAVREDLFTISEINNILFLMVHYVFNEHDVVSWIFKTSFISGIGNVDKLRKESIFIEDRSENFLEFVNETKPYHTKIRSLTEQKELELDQANVNMEETHELTFHVKFDRVSITTNYDSETTDLSTVDEDDLHAADRIELFYKPTEGMPEKDLAEVIRRGHYGGTIVDGKNFVQFGSELAEGYDSSEYDNFLGYDFDESDIENFYDVFINGGDNFALMSVNDEDIIVDGNKFIQPEIEEDHPEELVKIRSGDSININVYTQSSGRHFPFGYDADEYDQEFGYDFDPTDLTVPYGGFPKVAIKRITGQDGTGPFSFGQRPQNSQSIFIYLNDDLLKATDYTVDWNEKTPTLTLVAPLVDTDVLKIMSFRTGGSGILKRKLTRNTSQTVYDLNQSFTTDSQILVTVDGEVATFSTSGTEITVLSPVPSGSAVFIAIFEDEFYSLIRTQEETAAGGTETFIIDRPAESTVPSIISTVVYMNGLRLSPPYMKLYIGDAMETTYKTVKEPAAAGNVQVYVNQAELVQGVDYTIDISSSEIVLADAPEEDISILIIVNEDNDYEIVGAGLDELNVLDGSGNPFVHTAGDLIKVITFTEDISFNMQTEVFDGNARGFYPLGTQPFDTNSVWISVNGESQMHIKDYVLRNEEIGYDSELEGYGMLYDSTELFGVDFKDFEHDENDKIVITYFTGIPAEKPVAFKLFKNIFGNWENLRISDENTTVLAQPLLSSDNEIVVEDSTILGQPDVANNIPGIIYIGGEKIKFWDIDDTLPGNHILQNVLRGTGGSGININLPVGELVHDGSLDQIIPGGYVPILSGKGIQYDAGELTKFLLKKAGTHNFKC